MYTYQLSILYLFWLHKMHMHVCISTSSTVMANVKVRHLTLKHDIDLKRLPLKICGFMRCTCMQNVKSLSVQVQIITNL